MLRHYFVEHIPRKELFNVPATEAKYKKKKKPTRPWYQTLTTSITATLLQDPVNSKSANPWSEHYKLSTFLLQPTTCSRRQDFSAPPAAAFRTRQRDCCFPYHEHIYTSEVCIYLDTRRRHSTERGARRPRQTWCRKP